MKPAGGQPGFAARVSSQQAKLRSGGARLFLLSVAFLPIQFRSGLGGRLAPSDLLLLLAVGAGVPGLVGAVRRIPIGALGLLILLPASGIGSVFAGNAVGVRLVVTRGFGLLVLLGYLCCALAVSQIAGGVRQIARYLVAPVALTSGLSLMAYLSSHLGLGTYSWINYGGSTRVSGLLVDPNAFGLLVGVAFFLVPVTEWTRRVQVVAASVMIGALAFSYSRTAWIAWGAGLLVLLILRPRNRSRYLRRVGGVILAAVALGLFFAPPSLSDTSLAVRNLGDRDQILASSLRLWLDHPVFGAGIGSHAAKFGVIIHDSGLWLLVELGVLGLLCFLAIVIAPIRAGLHARRRWPQRRLEVVAFIAAQTVMCIGSLGIEALGQRSWWLVMGVLLGYSGWRTHALLPTDPAIGQDPRQ